MANYSSYLGLIVGKTFPRDYIYRAIQYSPHTIDTTTGGDYQGYLSDFAPGGTSFANDATFGPIQIVDADKGLFSFTSNPAYSLFQLVGATDNGSSLVFSTVPDTYAVFPVTEVFVLTSNGVSPTGTIGFSSSNVYNPQNSACFASGTMIRTARGEVAIEKLKTGQLIRSKDGRLQPIKWIGRRTTRCVGNPWKHGHFPIVIERHAFASDIPNRDLYVSQWHSFEVDSGQLLQIAYLLNGRTIRRVAVDEITYWHIELEEHGLILANGTSAETYIDVGNRHEFDNYSISTAMDRAFVEAQIARYCFPLIKDEAIREHHRQRLDARAEALRTARSSRRLDGLACALRTIRDRATTLFMRASERKLQ